MMGSGIQFSPSYVSQLEQAKEFIAQHDRFLVVSHVNPDGDAAGSTLAVGQILSQLGKTYVMMNESHVPAKFQMLPGWGEIRPFTDRTEAGDDVQFDCVIAVDCADYERIGAVRNLFPPELPLLNIDHHPTNDRFGTHQVIRSDAAATAEILYDLVQVLEISWERPLAECIYTGLLTDTGGFRYSNTTPYVMTIASEMLSHGVNGNQLADELLEKLTFSHVSVLKRSLATLSFSPDKRIAWMWATLSDIKESGADNGDLEGLVNYPRNIEGVEVGLLFKQAGERKFKVSLRSAGKADVSRIAQHFGGGGHVRAAGCTVEGELQEVIDQVLKEVGQALS